LGLDRFAHAVKCLGRVGVRQVQDGEAGWSASYRILNKARGRSTDTLGEAWLTCPPTSALLRLRAHRVQSFLVVKLVLRVFPEGSHLCQQCCLRHGCIPRLACGADPCAGAQDAYLECSVPLAAVQTFGSWWGWGWRQGRSWGRWGRSGGSRSGVAGCRVGQGLEPSGIGLEGTPCDVGGVRATAFDGRAKRAALRRSECPGKELQVRAADGVVRDGGAGSRSVSARVRAWRAFAQSCEQDKVVRAHRR
jgi:hypothetical protein